MKVTLTRDDGTEHDVTEHFKLLWDTVTHSMDWGSGFLDLEEYLKICHAGLIAGFDIDDLIPTDTIMPMAPGYTFAWNEPRGDFKKRLASFEAYIAERLAKYDQIDPTEPGGE